MSHFFKLLILLSSLEIVNREQAKRTKRYKRRLSLISLLHPLPFTYSFISVLMFYLDEPLLHVFHSFITNSLVFCKPHKHVLLCSYLNNLLIDLYSVRLTDSKESRENYQKITLLVFIKPIESRFLGVTPQAFYSIKSFILYRAISYIVG